MLFFQDEERFWKWSDLYNEHVASCENKVVKLAWELRSMEMFRAGWYDDVPEEVRTFLSEKVKETEARILQAAMTRDVPFLRQLYDAARLKRIKMTITAQAVMALLKLWEDLGRKPSWQELRARVEEMCQAEGLNPRFSDEQWETTRKALQSVL
jgi:hypothetical protein